MTKLSLVTAPPDDEFKLADEERPLREQIHQIVDGHREQILEAVRRWILYWVQLGARQLALDECPGVTTGDYDFVIEWLREEGFTVHRPMFWGRVTIDLRLERRQATTVGYTPERRQTRRSEERREPPQERREARREVRQSLSGIKRYRRNG